MSKIDYLDAYYTEEQMAEILGIAVPTLRNRITAGKNHPPYLPGKKKRFPKEDFYRWEKSRLRKELQAS